MVIRPSVVCGTEDNFTNLFSKLSILPVIPVVGINYKFQPILVTDVVDAINAIGTTSADLVAILEALRAAGALRAQMIII